VLDASSMTFTSTPFMFYHNDKWHNPEVAEWMYRLMNDPEYYEQWRYKDTIDNYNMITIQCKEEKILKLPYIW
jgi:hypothetical protein